MELTKINENLVNRIRKDIFYLIKKSYNVKNIENYSVIYADIMRYVELLDELDVYCDDIFKYIFPETRKDTSDKHLKENFEECKKTVQFDDDFVGKLADILIESNYFHGNFKNMIQKITENEMYEMTFDFLNNYNPSLSNQLSSMLKEERIIIKKSDGRIENGCTVCSITKFSPYIIIYSLHNIVDTVTLIHEMGHVYHFQKIEQLRNKQYFNIVYNNQLEVYSHYLELLSYDYFSGKINKIDILNLKRTLIKTLIEFYAYLEIGLTQLNIKNYKENYEDYFKDYNYGRGILIALEFYDMYQNDKEKADYNIEKYISETGKYDFLTTIDKYGLNREHIESCEAVKKYIKEIF